MKQRLLYSTILSITACSSLIFNSDAERQERIKAMAAIMQQTPSAIGRLNNLHYQQAFAATYNAQQQANYQAHNAAAWQTNLTPGAGFVPYQTPPNSLLIGQNPSTIIQERNVSYIPPVQFFHTTP